MAFSTHDIVPDSPTNVFATLNPLRAGTQNLADGNLKISAESENHWGTLAVDPTDSNKYYFEMIVITQKAGEQVVGVSNQSGTATNYLGKDANGWGIAFQSNANNGDLFNSSVTKSGITFSNGDIIQVCFTASKIWFGKNGTFIGNPSTETSPSFSNLSGTLSPVVTNRSSVGGSVCVNFGQDHLFGGATFSTAAINAGAGSNTPDNGIGTFAFSVPTDALALCTANLPDPDIDPNADDLPEDYMKAVKYIGTGGGQVDPVEVGFQPDLVWIKHRDAVISHNLYDSVRTTADGPLLSDQNIASDNIERITFSSDGFNRSSTNYSYTNSLNANYVAWCWKAGGAPTTDNSNTSGAMADDSVSIDGVLQSSITNNAYTPAGSPTIYPKRMSVNTKAGFSIVEYTGNGTSDITIPHGLGKRPSLMIAKNYENSGTDYHWHVHYFDGTNSRKWGYLNLTNALAADLTRVVNNNVIEILIGDTNRSSGKNIAYIWSEIAGYSAFGSYTGNGSADGPFVYTGFKPAWVMIKSSTYATTTYTSWAIYDNARETYNPNNNVLYANKSINEGYRGDASAAATDIDVDFLPNGFKVRSDKAEINQDTETYIYAAFAEQPFKYANAR